MKALRKLETIQFPTKTMAKDYASNIVGKDLVTRVRKPRGEVSKWGMEWILRIYKVNKPPKKNGDQLKSTDKRLKVNRKAKKTKVARVPATKTPKPEKSKIKSKTKAKKV